MIESLGVHVGRDEVVVVRIGPGGAAAARAARDAQQPADLSAALEQLGVRGADFDGPVGVCIPSCAASARVLSVGRLRRSRRAGHVAFALEGHLPESLEEADVRHVVLSEIGEGVDVLAAAVLRPEIAAVDRMLGSAGLGCDLLALDAEALAHAVADALPEDALLLVPGKDSTALVLREGGRIRAMRRLRYGTAGASADESVIARLVRDMALTTGGSARDEREVAICCLTPGGTDRSALVEGLTAAGVPVRSVAVPLPPALASGDDALAAAWAVARAAELRPPVLDWSTAAGAGGRRRSHLRPAAIASVLLCLLLSVLAAGDRRTAEALEDVAQELDERQTAAWHGVFPDKSVPPNIPLRLESELRRIQGVAGGRGDAPAYRCALEAFADVARNVPTRVKAAVDTLEFDQSGFTVRGQIEGHAAAEALARSIAEGRRFAVKPPRTESLGGNGSRVVFTLRGEHGPGDGPDKKGGGDAAR